MPDLKISALPAAAAVTTDDLCVIVDDPAGTPASKKATFAQIKAAIVTGIVNANVDNAAAIAGTKISPDFGAQDITTTGNLLLGATPRAAAGTMRVCDNFSLNSITSGIDRPVLSHNGGTIVVGGFSNLPQILLRTSGGSDIRHQINSVNQIIVSSTSMALGVPIIGDSLPFGLHGLVVVSLPDSNYTVLASEYSRYELQFNGSLTATRTVTFPHPSSNDRAYHLICNNNSGQTLTISTGTGTTYNLTFGAVKLLTFSTAGVRLAMA
jgi:hypothetical protein